jgi:hypothetical protein
MLRICPIPNPSPSGRELVLPPPTGGEVRWGQRNAQVLDCLIVVKQESFKI